jgi:starvation-inducible DNA-binding protein
VGPQFSELHKFFEAQYEEIDDIIDEVAERARALGGRSLGSLAEFLRHTRLKESSGDSPPAREMLADLLADHEALIRSLRADADVVGGEHADAGTNDFLVGLMEQHEKMAWMLRAFLEGA